VKQRLRVIQGGAPSIFEDLEALRIPPDDEGLDEVPQSAHRTKRRQFRRFDETWAETLLTADPPVSVAVWRLALVLLAAADFERHIKITVAITKTAQLTRFNKREVLERLEQLGLVRVEWRGRGRVPIATPLHLGGRPSRR
jgi:hypothetical protein